MTTDHELREIRREIFEEAVHNYGPRAVKELLDEIAKEARDELKGAELASVLREIEEEVKKLDLDLDKEPDDPCDEEFMEEIST